MLCDSRSLYHRGSVWHYSASHRLWIQSHCTRCCKGVRRDCSKDLDRPSLPLLPLRLLLTAPCSRTSAAKHAAPSGLTHLLRASQIREHRCSDSPVSHPQMLIACMLCSSIDLHVPSGSSAACLCVPLSDSDGVWCLTASVLLSLFCVLPSLYIVHTH